jgi:hypothetical protein
VAGWSFPETNGVQARVLNGPKIQRVRLLNLLERLGELPADVWFIPPVVILTGMAATGLIRRILLLRRYRAIAARTRLSVEPKTIDLSEIHGTYRGRALVMSVCSQQRPTFRKRWTRVTVDVQNPEHIGLFLRRQDAFDTAVMSVGGKDVQVGDPAFDRYFLIQSRDAPVVAKMFQDTDLRSLLVRSNIDSVQLLSTRMHAYYARNERDPEHANLLFTAVTALADAIDALRPDSKAEVIH